MITYVPIICLAVFLITIYFTWSYLPDFIADPFFWAFISMFALIGASSSLITKQLGRFPTINMTLVALFALGRIMLVLPFCCQPRFDFGILQLIIGTVIIFAGFIFLTSLFYIDPWPVADEKTKLETGGFYGIVRNPIYLGEILWSLGLAVVFGSMIGILLMPLWWGSFLFLVILEEEDLERKLGLKYLEYKNDVKGRILPGLPF
jgi:protein-S-isoprenylcysteine O-methyltransferase Ste14